MLPDFISVVWPEIDTLKCFIFTSKCTKIRLTTGLGPDPLGELTAHPQTPYLDLRGRRMVPGKETGERGRRRRNG